MEHKIELHETVGITDSVEHQLIKIKEDVDPILCKIKRLITGITIVTILFLAFCLIPFFTNGSVLNYERIIFASIGVLTFISIFYSLLISPYWKGIINKMTVLIDNKQVEIENLGKDEVKKSIDLDEMKSKIKDVQKKLDIIDEFKQIIDVEYLLIVTVFVLIFSIILVIFDAKDYHVIAYLFFTLGVTFSGAIVVIWRGLSRFAEGLDNNKDTVR